MSSCKDNIGPDFLPANIDFCQLTSDILIPFEAYGRDSEGAGSVNIFLIIIYKDTALRIHKILHTLKEPYKEVFSLRVFGELSYEDIGKLFLKSAGWACVTYYRAKTMILKELEEHNG